MADESAFRELAEKAVLQRLYRIEEELRACVRDGFRGALEVSGANIFDGPDGTTTVQFYRHEKMPLAPMLARALVPSSFFMLNEMTDEQWAAALAVAAAPAKDSP